MNIEEVVKLYYEEEKSLLQIAEKFNTYPKKVERLLKKHKYTLRSRSEAQKNALEKGNLIHPTAGKKRPESDKIAISEGMTRLWAKVSDEEREARREKHRQIWFNMSEEKRQKIRSAAMEGVRLSSIHGSKMERAVAKYLSDNGYESKLHVKGIITNTNLEVDIFMPELNCIIEIDGPSHFLPIWGEEKLQKTIVADNKKNGQLLQLGYNIVRVKILAFRLSKKTIRDTCHEVLEKIQSLSSKKGKLLEIEIA